MKDGHVSYLNREAEKTGLIRKIRMTPAHKKEQMKDGDIFITLFLLVSGL